MRLDVTCMRYMSKDEFRVLTAVEMGMKNHDVVPVELIISIAKLRHGGVQKFLATLLRFKLIYHDKTTYDGYRLTYQGYDILALKTLLTRGHIAAVGQKVGVGKESDIYLAQTEGGEEVILKFHRLGRVSFRAVKNKRDYLQHRKSASWLYMSRLAALREFAFMKALHEHGFPTPTPIDQNRHVVCMSRVEGFPMFQVKQGNMANPERIFPVCMQLIAALAKRGLVHCDFNEFNLMINEAGVVTLIDFPQMISTSHVNAQEMFERDVNGVVKFFAMKMHYVPEPEEIPKFAEVVGQAAAEGEEGLDEVVKASGYLHAVSQQDEARFLENVEASRRARPEGRQAEEGNEEDGSEEDESEREWESSEEGWESDDDEGSDEGSEGGGDGSGEEEEEASEEAEDVKQGAGDGPN